QHALEERLEALLRAIRERLDAHLALEPPGPQYFSHRDEGPWLHPSLRLGGLRGVRQEMFHGVRRLGALLDPLRRLLRGDLDGGRLGQRVVVPDDLDESPVARCARVGPPHAVGRLPCRPSPSQSDVYRHLFTSFVWLSGQACYLGKNGMAPLSLPMRPSICLRPFIICLSCAYCFSSRLTSATWVPLPLAIRARRLPLMIAGLTRSSGVIEPMIASKRLRSLSSPLSSLGRPFDAVNIGRLSMICASA